MYNFFNWNMECIKVSEYNHSLVTSTDKTCSVFMPFQIICDFHFQ